MLMKRKEFIRLGMSTLAIAGLNAMAPGICSATTSKVFNVHDFGAKGNGVTLDTATVQTAINACTQAGGGTVWVPAGNYPIGTIHLKSNVTLWLDYGASLLGSTNHADYPTEGLRAAREGQSECLLYAEDAANIRFEGLGVIDGRGYPKFFPKNAGPGGRDNRPSLFRFENCRNLTFSGLTYKNPAFWGIHLVDCRDIHFDAVTIRFRNNGANNDGMDLDGCENVLIENCDIETGDDAICPKSSRNPCRNIVVRNCKLSSATAAFKCGTSSRGGFIDVRVTDCYFYDCPMGAIKLELVDGGRLENVKIDRIVMKNVGNPIFIRLGNRGRWYEKKGIKQIYKAGSSNVGISPEGVPVGILKNIRISNVDAEVTVEDRAEASRVPYRHHKMVNTPGLTDGEKARSGPIMITGIPGHYVEDVVLQNVKISYPGGGTAEDAKRIVPEDIARYPEQFFFGVLPAWGAYIRHARNIKFENVEMQTRAPDQRKKIVLDDVEGFVEQ